MHRAVSHRPHQILLAFSRFVIEAEHQAFLKLLSVFALLILAHTPAQALDPSRHISEYGHSKWTIQDGTFSGRPTAIAQTTDGYLWFGTVSGLMRFDGVRYVRPDNINAKLPSSAIYSLEAARDGSLWIGTDVGLSRWVNQKVINYPDVIGWVLSILEDRAGKIWFTLTDRGNDKSGAFCFVVGLETKCYGQTAGVLLERASGLAQDSAGDLWSIDRDAVVRWQPGSFTTYKIKGLKSKGVLTGGSDIALAPAGSLWAGIDAAGPGLGLQQLDQGKWKPFVTSELDSSTLRVYSLLLDQQGALWIGTEGQGLYRIRAHKVDRFSATDGLSSDTIYNIHEDHEGNLWVATATGIDCFHELPVTTLSGAKGSTLNEADGVLASRDGTVWVARPASLEALRGENVFSLKTGKGLPGDQVTALLEDHAGRLWVGIDRTLSIYQNGTFHPIQRKGGRSIGSIAGLTEDVENNVWAEVNVPPRTLFRIRDLKVVDEFPSPQMPAARKVAADPEGGIWLGLSSGNLARYRKGHLELFAYPRNGAKAEVKQLTVSPDGVVLGATRTGLIAWKNGQKQTLTIRNGLPCDNVFSQVIDNQDSLWLYTECGLIEIAKAEVERWWQEPEAKLRMRILDVLDGAQPGDAPFDGAARTPDGRLWFVNFLALQMIDPSRTAVNRIVPPVSIEQLIADRKSYSTRENIRLPPLTRDLEIDYTGLSFSAPQKVRFRYKLEDHDGDWQEPGTRRQAFYTDLRPGKYNFRVVACNNDGLWNEQGAVLAFSVAPTWYQTNWFRLSCVAASSMLLWALYQVRLHQLAKEFNTKADASVAERTRIARELHDTLLQSLHGLMFRFQAARNMLPRRPEEAMEALDGAITRTAQAIAESRDAIKDLRVVPSAQSDIAESLAAIGQELARSHEADDSSPLFSVTVEGQPRPLSPIVQDEVRRIAHEVLTNAFRHAGAHRIEAEVRYDDHSLRLRLRDNGRGIDPEILKVGGRPGHWGLPGIRERAQKISAKLDFWSEAGAGTEVQLTVPAAFGYEKSRERWRSGFFRRWSKRERRS